MSSGTDRMINRMRTVSALAILLVGQSVLATASIEQCLILMREPIALADADRSGRQE